MEILFAISPVEYWVLNPNRGQVWAPLTAVLHSCALRQTTISESSLTTKRGTYRLASDLEQRPPNNAMNRNPSRRNRSGFPRRAKNARLIAADRQDRSAAAVARGVWLCL